MKQESVAYLNETIQKTGKDLQFKNVQAFVRIEKVVVHIGFGRDKGNQSIIETLKKDLEKITGQKASLRKAKKSVATFKLRAGEPIGIMVTLRGKKMADFLNKLVNVALPAIRDFRGLPDNSFDKQGNYNIGIREYSVFPEISFSGETVTYGLQVTIATTTKNPDEARQLLTNYGFPFASKEKNA